MSTVPRPYSRGDNFAGENHVAGPQRTHAAGPQRTNAVSGDKIPLGAALVTREISDDLPAFGNPTSPTSANNFSCSVSHPSSPDRPRSAKRGV